MVNTKRIDLPDGDWAEVREAKKVPERLRRPVRVAAINLQRSLPEDQRRGIVKIADEPEHVAGEDVQEAFGTPPVADLLPKEDEDKLPFIPSEEQQTFVDAYNEALILSVVTEWSFGEVTSAMVQDLPGDAFDELLAYIRKDGEEVGSSDSLADDPTSP